MKLVNQAINNSFFFHFQGFCTTSDAVRVAFQKTNISLLGRSCCKPEKGRPVSGQEATPRCPAGTYFVNGLFDPYICRLDIRPVNR